MENNWIENVSGVCPIYSNFRVDVMYSDGEEKLNTSAGRCNWKFYGEPDDIKYWRLHDPKQSLDDALGSDTISADAFQYPQTAFKPSSEAQLRSDEATRINSLLSEKLSTISDIASKLTRKNFSVADIKLVKDLLESVEEYEENK